MMSQSKNEIIAIKSGTEGSFVLFKEISPTLIMIPSANAVYFRIFFFFIAIARRFYGDGSNGGL